LGGFENDAALAASSTAKAPGAAPSAGSGVALARQREVIEKISLNYFGPIASLLCEEAFEASSDIGQILEQIAANLPTPAETQRFLKEARAALAVVR
ncbi:MAG TPA: hypothetical protein DDZ67_09725, partial [Xanthomonadaceae bacterium]|nr:hypothetical protein [Xanthomonadaceae bacterium]